jgi:PAS domain S-box-containing protein
MDACDQEIAELKRDLTALRESNQDLLDFLDNASLALYWVTSDGRILWANQAQLNLLGYAGEEYIGRHFADFHVDAPASEDILERFKRKEALHNYEARLRGKDGLVRHVLFSCTPLWSKGEFVHMRCVARDITQRKQYEQRLLTQFEIGRVLLRADSLAAAAPGLLEAIARPLDWQTGLLWALQEEEQVLCLAAHWDRSEADGDGFATLCRSVVFSRGVCLPGRVWSTKAPSWIADLRSDGQFRRQDAAAAYGLRSAFALPILLGEKVHGVMEFFASQTRPVDEELLKMAASLGYQIGEFLERIRFGQRLTEGEESYRVLTETASDGIITIDAASTIVFANTAAAEIFGYTTNELRGSNVTLLMPEHARASYFGAITRHLETGQKPLTRHAIRFSGQHRAGYEIPIEVSFGEYRSGNKHFFVGVIRDITERNRLDEAMRQAAKLESLGVLAGGIAHDFNNLLTGILGNVSLGLDMLEDASPIKEILQDAIEASERAANLTKQLLAYAGKGRFLIEPTDISVLVREMSAFVRSSIPKHVTLRLDLQEPLPPVEADVAQLQQLIMNLVINGAEAIPEGRQGTVLVITRAQEIDYEQLEALGATDIATGAYVTIGVHDNGVGMDAATLGKIFDPFFSTKFTGRGLGLSAAGGIVRGHSGAMKVFSSPGQGTTFKVLLPVAAAVRNREVERSVRLDLSGRGMVLVIDDEPIVRKIAVSSLERYGYTVVTANDGAEGVECFRELHAQLKVVILDMTMPVMSGEETLRLMRQIEPRVPVILSSGYNEVEAIQRFTGKGLAGFLQKPYTAASLAEKIQTILHEAD